MDASLKQQLRFLQALSLLLVCCVGFLCVNLVHPLLHQQRFGVIDAEQLNIRERNGTLKAVLSNAAGLNKGDRATSGPPRLSGLLFYNEEGLEEGGLVFQGAAIQGGQDSDVSLTMDQYRQDQNVYLNHSEHVDRSGSDVSDGLQINSRPDWTKIEREFALYKELKLMPKAMQERSRLQALRNGSIETQRLFYGVKRGVHEGSPFDNAGLFVKDRLGRDAIRLYVDYNNQPHLEISDQSGHLKSYNLGLAGKQ